MEERTEGDKDINWIKERRKVDDRSLHFVYSYDSFNEAAVGSD